MQADELLAAVLIAGVLGSTAYMYTTRPDFDLKCIVSNVDGNTYCVRERKRMQEAADLLATVTSKMRKFVEYLRDKHPDNDGVQRLVKNFNPEVVQENLPTSKFTAYSENKGKKLAFCVNRKKGGSELIDEHTLTFTYIHELGHLFTKSIGHKDEFWRNFKFLLEEAKAGGFHEPRDYKKAPVEYCSMQITDSPYYDYH